jgi:glycosyltransferase involved in cell wall biosynthesis
MAKLRSVCLNMIVKDESKVIRRCILSIKNLIDYWVIVDTGSTDGTQEIIKETLKDIPGELYERPWKNFEHNRNEAMRLAYPKARYLLFIDADEVLKAPKNFSLGSLDKDIFLINVQLPNGTMFARQFMIGTRIRWFWKGVVHEQVYTDVKSTTHRFLEDAYIYASDDGGRTGDDSSVKFLHDAEVLEEALKTDPRNSRYVFYLANSYSNAKKLELALKNYEKRAIMGGWDQEVFYSLYCIGRIQNELEMPPEVFIASFYKAYRYRMSRAEPLFWIANHYMEIKDYDSAYDVLKEAVEIPLSKDAMMVERSVYEYVLKWMFADCLFSKNLYEEAAKTYEELLQKPNLPKEVRPVMMQNLRLLQKNLKKGQ